MYQVKVNVDLYNALSVLRYGIIRNIGVRTRIFWCLRPHHCLANSRSVSFSKGRVGGRTQVNRNKSYRFVDVVRILHYRRVHLQAYSVTNYQFFIKVKPHKCNTEPCKVYSEMSKLFLVETFCLPVLSRVNLLILAGNSYLN